MELRVREFHVWPHLLANLFHLDRRKISRTAPAQAPKKELVGSGGAFSNKSKKQSTLHFSNNLCNKVQRWAKEWALGCVNSPHAARGSQEAGFTQPRDHSLADHTPSI